MTSMAWMWTTMRRFQGHLLQKDLLGLVAFPFVPYALCRFLQLHSYPCLNSHVWIVLLGNEQLVELSLELGNRLLPWISFLNPMMILGHDYERNINIYIESNMVHNGFPAIYIIHAFNPVLSPRTSWAPWDLSDMSMQLWTWREVDFYSQELFVPAGPSSIEGLQVVLWKIPWAVRS